MFSCYLATGIKSLNIFTPFVLSQEIYPKTIYHLRITISKMEVNPDPSKEAVI